MRHLRKILVTLPVTAGFLLATTQGAPPSTGETAAVAHWRAQLAQDSAIPQEGYLQVQPGGQVVGNAYWGPCHPDPSFVHQLDCPEAGTPQAAAFTARVRQQIAQDHAQLAAALSASTGG
jgi:hypothetical protein